MGYWEIDEYIEDNFDVVVELNNNIATIGYLHIDGLRNLGPKDAMSIIDGYNKFLDYFDGVTCLKMNIDRATNGSPYLLTKDQIERNIRDALNQALYEHDRMSRTPVKRIIKDFCLGVYRDVYVTQKYTGYVTLLDDVP